MDLWDVVRLHISSSYWNVLGKYGTHSELFFFQIRKEPVALTKAVPFTPVVPAETLKPHALIGLHSLQQKVKLDQVVVSLLTLETCEDTVA